MHPPGSRNDMQARVHGGLCACSFLASSAARHPPQGPRGQGDTTCIATTFVMPASPARPRHPPA